MLESVNASHPGQPDILNGLLAFARDAGDRRRYERYRTTDGCYASNWASLDINLR